MFKKIILSILVVLFLFFNSINAVNAVWYDQGLLEFGDKVFDPSSDEIFGERYTYAQVTWIAHSLASMLLGGKFSEILTNISTVQQGEGEENDLLPYNSAPEIGGSFGVSSKIVDTVLYSPPASGIQYVADKIQDFRVVPVVYAQSGGFGFNAMETFLPLWRAVRNFSYLLITIVILAMAFAIMFRVKLNPQTVVSLQTAIPKIFIILILITFSYAIAGFVIDLMYLIFGLFVFGIDKLSGLPAETISSTAEFNSFLTDNWQDLLGFVASKGLSGLVQTFGGTALVGGGIATGITAIIVAFTTITYAAVAVVLAPAILPLLLGVLFGLMVFIIKIILMLAQTYLSLIINIVAGPFIILFEAFPGNKGATMGWLKSITADSLVFLVLGLLLFFQNVLIKLIDMSSSTIWGPPYLGQSPTFLKGIIALGVISILPNIRKVVYQFMQKRSLDVEAPREFSGALRGASRTVSEGFQKSLPTTDTSGTFGFKNPFKR